MTQENVLPSNSSREFKTQERVSLLQQVREGLQADQRVYFRERFYILRTAKDGLRRLILLLLRLNQFTTPKNSISLWTV